MVCYNEGHFKYGKKIALIKMNIVLHRIWKIHRSDWHPLSTEKEFEICLI